MCPCCCTNSEGTKKCIGKMNTVQFEGFRVNNNNNNDIWLLYAPKHVRPKSRVDTRLTF